MDQPRRFVFRGNASGVAAHIRRPVNILLPVQAASSLPVTGGLSESTAGPLVWGGRRPSGRQGFGADADTYIKFDSATTRAFGDFVDPEQAIAMTLGKLRFDEVPSQTTVSAEVKGLVVIGRVAVGTAAMELAAESGDGIEPPIHCTSATLDGVSVDGYPVNINLAPEFYCENDTMSKLAAAADTGKYSQFFIEANRAARYGFCSPGGTVLCTLVSSIEWADKPHPEATIDGNTIIIPNYGRVYFGELLVTLNSRRLTMVRFQLGSDDGGDASGASGDTNGSNWPPSGP